MVDEPGTSTSGDEAGTDRPSRLGTDLDTDLDTDFDPDFDIDDPASGPDQTFFELQEPPQPDVDPDAFDREAGGSEDRLAGEAEATGGVVLNPSIAEDDPVSIRQEISTRRRGTGGRGRRAAGRLLAAFAVILGGLGVVLSLVAALLIALLGFRAADEVDDVLAPVTRTLDRVELRIDQADDVVDRDGIGADRLAEFRARAVGLTDIAVAADQATAAVRGHPVYQWLPTDDGPLLDAVDDIGDQITQVEMDLARMPDSTRLGAADAAALTTRLNELQATVSDVDDTVDAFGRSLERWIRISAAVLTLVGLWSAWAQFQLARWGLTHLRRRRR